VDTTAELTVAQVDAVVDLLPSWTPGLHEDVFALHLAHVVGRWLGARPATLAGAGRG
jgi:hypothetical protein